MIPTVFLVDDDKWVRSGVRRVLQSANYAVAEYASAEEFLERFDPAVPGCLVLDLAMPGLDGLDLQRRLTVLGASLPIIFLTGRANVPSTVEAMKAGAVDFLTKPVEDELLLRSITVALERDRSARRDQAEVAAISKKIATLTAREREVLDRIAAGKLNKQIAHELGIAVKTVKFHRARVKEKLGVASVADIVRLVERGRVGDTTAAAPTKSARLAPEVRNAHRGCLRREP